MNKRLRTVLGLVLSFGLLWWALRDVSLAEVADRIRDADPVLFSAAVFVMLAGFWTRAIRWGVLLFPVAGRVPFRSLLAATFIGFGVNNVLPARIGEFARAYSLSRQEKVSVGSSFATLVLERLLDGVALISLLFISMASSSFPTSSGGPDVRSGALVAAVIMAGVGVALYIGVAAPALAGRIARFAARLLPSRLREPTLAALRSFAIGLAVLRSPRLFIVSALLAFGQWAFLATSYQLGYLAFGIDTVPYAGAVFLQSLISLAVAIPSSPGFFGPFEAGARIGLGIWGVPAEQAISFAIGFHIAGFIPVTLIAIYYIWRLGLSWSQMRAGEEEVEEEMEKDPTAAGFNG